MDGTGQKRLHAIVEGRVQGVGFRNYVMDEALRLDLTGWVRNTYSGAVEVIAEGPEPALHRLLKALHQGPRLAMVIQVREEWTDAQVEYSSFQMRSTG